MNGDVQNIISQATSSQNALNSQNYNSIAQTIRNSLSSIVQSMNTNYNGMYLFGGTNYKTAPISIDSNGKAVVTSEDISGEVKTQVSSTTNSAINVPGSKVVDTGIFDSINQIIDTLQSGNAPDEAAVNKLEASYQRLLDVQSAGGNTYNRLDNISQQLTTQQTNLQTILQNKIGVDPAKLSVDLQNQDYMLQMSYKILANTFSKSILDYI
jgi:flagellar hook-associated protein 3 FlgL